MSSLVCDRYIGFIYQLLILGRVPLSFSPSFKLYSIGVSAGLQPLILVSSKRSRVYFRCETTMPFLERATNILRKYLNVPKSLIRHYFNLSISNMSSLMKIVSI